MAGRPRRTKYTIGSQSFRTKKELKKAVYRIRDQTPSAEPIMGRDRDFLINFFQHHPYWDEKTRGGIQDIYLNKDESGRHRCFYLRTKEGSVDDISVRKTLLHWGKSTKWTVDHDKRTYITIAARQEIADQIEEFRAGERAVSRISGKELSPINAHVDHWDTPFKTLLNDWMASLLADTDLSTREVAQGKRKFLNREVARSWKNYHRKNAKLAFLSASENMSKGCRKIRGV